MSVCVCGRYIESFCIYSTLTLRILTQPLTICSQQRTNQYPHGTRPPIGQPRLSKGGVNQWRGWLQDWWMTGRAGHCGTSTVIH